MGRMKRSTTTSSHSALTIGLADPGMTPLLRAGLGGLAASLRALHLQTARAATWPAAVAVGGAVFTVAPRSITIDWRNGEPSSVLEALFEHAFRVSKPHGMIDLPGTYAVGAPPSPQLAAALQSAIKRTFLQHGRSTKKSGAVRAISFTVDDAPFTTSVQPYTTFAHRDAWQEIASSLDRPIELAGWAYPGATQRHVAFPDTKQEYAFGHGLCAIFALVGTLSFEVPRGNAGALVIPEPSDLVAYAVARPLMSPRTLSDVYVGSASDAVLSVQLVLRMEELTGHPAVRRTTGALLKPTPWASQQKTRVRIVETGLMPEPILDLYERASRDLPTRIRASKDDGGGYFATTSSLRAFVADNLAACRPWFTDFSTATTSEKNPRYLHYYRTRKGLGGLWSEERRGLIAMTQHLEDAETALVRSVQTALRQRFGAIAEECRGSARATMHNRFQSERDRWRLAFAGSKTPEQIRGALADLWSRAGSNRELRTSWEIVLPLLRPQVWQTARDLALVALASYQGAGAEDEGGEDGSED